MDDILCAASTQTLEELVDALLLAANNAYRWEDERAARARAIMQKLGITWTFVDWQEAFDILGVQALEVLRSRYRQNLAPYIC